jgi:hypothetical protein
MDGRYMIEKVYKNDNQPHEFTRPYRIMSRYGDNNSSLDHRVENSEHSWDP